MVKPHYLLRLWVKISKSYTTVYVYNQKQIYMNNNRLSIEKGAGYSSARCYSPMLTTRLHKLTAHIALLLCLTSFSRTAVLCIQLICTSHILTVTPSVSIENFSYCVIRNTSLAYSYQLGRFRLMSNL